MKSFLLIFIIKYVILYKRENKMVKQRDVYLDVLRGVGIVLVVLAHILNDNWLGTVIYYFHMPFFFFISGMSMYYSYKEDLKFKDYLIKKTKSIIIPYIIFSIIFFIYWAVIERKIRNQYDIPLLSNFTNIFTGFIEGNWYVYDIVMWFLPCLFTTEIIFYGLMKFKKFKFVSSFILFVIGYILSINNIILPWGIETAFISILFFYFGYIYKQKKSNLLKNKFICIILFLLSIIDIIVLYKLNYTMGMLGHNYGNIALFLIGVLSGSYIILFVCEVMVKFLSAKLINIFSFLGKNTIIIMCCHEPIKRIVIKLVSIITNISEQILRSNIIYSLIITTVILFVILPIIFIINKYLPFVIGRKTGKNLKLKEEN